MAILVLALAALVGANLVNGAMGGIASLAGLGRPATWVVTLVGLGLCLVLAGWLTNRRLDGVFINDRNKISLSRLQLVVWTTLLVSALLTAGLSNASLGSANPLEIAVPPSVWALLGIGSFTFVAAPTILRQKQSAPAPGRLALINKALKEEDGLAGDVAAEGSVIVKQGIADARWLDIVRGDEADADRVDVSKVQQLAFTFLLVTVYGTGIMNTMTGISPVTTFPPVDEGFVALLGLSHAAYLTYKAMPKTV